MTNKRKTRSAWAWVPTLYFAEGLPYVLVMTVSVIMYKGLGISNGKIAFYTSWLYLPWVVKPVWSPLVDLLKTKRWWIFTTQFLVAAGLAAVAFTLPTTYFFQATIALFWLMAFVSATHDIAADGFYMIALGENDQTFWVGIRTIFYRVAMWAGNGLFVLVAGKLIEWSGNAQWAWSAVFGGTAVLFAVLAAHHYVSLPRPASDAQKSIANIGRLFVSFFTKKGIVVAMLFILFFRFGEAQLAKIASPFLLDARADGGLGLSVADVGMAYGTVGLAALMLGGILGGVAASRNGLRFWLWPMILAMNVPNLIYVYFAVAQPASFWLVCSGVALEQFGYGFGLTAFMLYLIYFSKGEYKTAHYAICTGFMALGMMIPGMFSGFLQESVGYPAFFVWICLCTIPGFLLAALLKIPRDFGKK